MGTKRLFMMQSNRSKIVGLVVGIIVLIISMVASILFGHQQFGVKDLWLAYSEFDGSNEHLILTTTRVPRALIAAAVGASLATLALSCKC